MLNKSSHVLLFVPPTPWKSVLFSLLLHPWFILCFLHIYTLKKCIRLSLWDFLAVSFKVKLSGSGLVNLITQMINFLVHVHYHKNSTTQHLCPECHAYFTHGEAFVLIFATMVALNEAFRIWWVKSTVSCECIFIRKLSATKPNIRMDTPEHT